MITSKIDRETYKRNKVKELMSLETESDNEWFEENNLIKNQNELKTGNSLPNQNEIKAENKSNSYEDKGEGQKYLKTEIEDFDFNDTLSSRLDAFQEKINAMLAEGNKMLNQSVSRENVDLTSYSSNSSKRRHRRRSHNKAKVAFANDVLNDDSEMSLNSELNNKSLNSTIDDKSSSSISKSKDNGNNEKDTSHKRKSDKSKKSDNSQKLNGKNMLQDAISFSKLVLNNDKKKTPDLLSNKRSNSPKPIISSSSTETKDNDISNDNSKITRSNSLSKNSTIDSILDKTFNDGESILQMNELELLRIEIKELKEKNRQLQQENMNLKIQNSSLTEKQKQQEQQIEKLKQTNSQLQRLVSDTTYRNSSNSNSSCNPTPPNSNPSSPNNDYNNNQDMSHGSLSSDSELNMSSSNSSFMSVSKVSNNKLNSINNEIINSALNKLNSNSNNSMNITNDTNNNSHGISDDSFDHSNSGINSIKSIRKIKNMEYRRYSLPQKFMSSNNNIISSIENLETSNDISSSRKSQFNNSNIINNRNRSISNASFYHSSPKTKSILYSNNNNDNKRHSMFADIKSYGKIIEGWKSIENKDNNKNQNINNQNNSNNMNEINSNNSSNNKNVENIKTDIMNNSNNKLSNKRYSFVYPNNNDKTKRYSFSSDVSSIDEIRHDVNEYIDKLNSPEVANNKTRVRKISESYANDIRRREDILKNCSLSPPVFKYSNMRDIDLMTSYSNRYSSLERKEDKEYKRKSILDQISYIRIDDESVNNIKKQVYPRISGSENINRNSLVKSPTMINDININCKDSQEIKKLDFRNEKIGNKQRDRKSVV